MGLDFGSLVKSASDFGAKVLSNVPSSEAAWKTLTENRVAEYVKPHFEKYAKPYLETAYKHAQPHVAAHPYIAGGAVAFVALGALRMLMLRK